MPTLYKEQKMNLYILGICLVIADIIIWCSGQDIFSAVISTASFYISIIAMYLSSNALKVADETLILTKNAMKTNNIEKSFDYFYYPLKDFLDNLDKGIQVYDQDIVIIGHYRYLATEETRIVFQNYKPVFLKNGNSNNPYYKELVKCVDLDIDLKTKEKEKY